MNEIVFGGEKEGEVSSLLISPLSHLPQKKTIEFILSEAAFGIWYYIFFDYHKYAVGENGNF